MAKVEDGTTEDVVTRLEHAAERVRRAAGGASGGSYIPLMAQAGLYESAAREITSLRSELARKDWQPIETAPKDGTRVLLGLNCSADGGGTKVETGYWGLIPAEYEETNYGPHTCIFDGCEGWLGESWFPGADQPSHWMPLHTPPSSSALLRALISQKEGVE